MAKLPLKSLPMIKIKIILFFIFIFGLTLRLWKVDSIPPGLNRDEASIGYTAYSLIKTGKDEYGIDWPFSFKTFGDWKLPLYIYLTIPSIKLFGLSEIAIRLPTVIFSSLTIINIYLLAKILFHSRSTALLSSLFFAISPWSLHLSRNESEAHSSIFFTTLGLLFFFRSKGKLLKILLGTIFLVIPLYMYHGNHIYTPLLYIGLLIVSWKENLTLKNAFLSILLFVAFTLFIYSKTLLSADVTKISGLFAANDPALVHENINLNRLEHTNILSFTTALFHNRFIFTGLSVIQNYILGFSPEFLFITGGTNLQHNIPDFGNLYLWEAPFIILGLYFIFANKNISRGLILWWLLISPIAASLTKDAPHTNRMAPFLPLPYFLISYAVIETVKIIKNIKVQTLIILSKSLILLLLVLNFMLWTDRYFIHFPIKREFAWGGGYRELVAKVTLLQDRYSEIVMDRPDYSPYIYFLFYQQVDPELFQNRVIRYPVDSEGFHHVKSFNNLTFKKLDWSKALIDSDKLIISWAESTPPHATNSSYLIDDLIFNRMIKEFGGTFDLKIGDQVINRLIKEIKLKNGQPQFYLIEVKRILT